MQKINIHDNLLIAFTDKADGNIDERFSSKREVKKTRKQIFEDLDLQSAQVIEAQQIHGTRILPLNEENSKMWKGMNVTGVDGFITDQDSVALMLRLADCAALVMYDPEHTAVGVFHAGWKGVLSGIQTVGLDMMMQHYETDPKKLIVWVSPCARHENYKMMDEPKQSKDEAWKDYIYKKGKFWHVDFPGYALQTLKEKGVLKKNMHDEGTCTIVSDDHFSHYESKQSEDMPHGRCAVIVKLHKGVPVSEKPEIEE